MPRRREAKVGQFPAVLLLAGGGFAFVIVLLVVVSFRRPDPPVFTPTPIELRPAGGRLVAGRRVTIDATHAHAWRYFSFADGSVVEDPPPAGWDLAFRRFQVIVNGGPGFAGDGGILDLGAVQFDSVQVVPEHGYVPTGVRGDSVNPAIQRWYSYSFTSHLLSPKPHVYAVRTADGRFAKLEFLGYYCPGATPGCPTFRYTFHGGGGARLE